ncbi:E3 ubiquitin-protein ligase ATL4 [Humulus lupulus]|uniref:E3 ubiquitin-protein ligase ATL4 n=1 Tax=Humulus lupulus TaxID=3486 RepID=UPI002B408686|nr:E3 ubiquitin-protein ligase ATL4 [Humulus lupulus]
MSSQFSPPSPPLTTFFPSTAVPPPIPHHHAPSLSPSILIIILILAVTFVASVSLCFLLRHLNRRCLRHLSPSSSTSSSAVVANVDSLRISSRRVSPENPTTALIESLPLFTFSSLTRRNTSAADCAVCLSKFEADDQLRLLPLCCHAFHAFCVDTWLQSNQTCPLCRSQIFVSEAEILKTLLPPDGENHGADSFRIEIGNVSRRQPTSESGASTRRSYSIGSFEYLVDDDSEIVLGNAHRRTTSDFKEDQFRPPPASHLPAPEPSLVAEVASGRSWLKEYVDRLSMSLSSRAQSFRSSGRFFSGSSRRSEVTGVGDWDLEACRVGEEISELFRWASGV